MKHSPTGVNAAVLLKTILNFVEPYKSFIYGKVTWVDPETKTTLEVEIQPRKNSRAICSGCGQQTPGYGRLSGRFEDECCFLAKLFRSGVTECRVMCVDRRCADPFLGQVQSLGVMSGQNDILAAQVVGQDRREQSDRAVTDD